MITASGSLGMHFFDLENDKCLTQLQKLKDKCQVFTGQEYPKSEPEHPDWWHSMCGYDKPKWVIVQAEDDDIIRVNWIRWFLSSPKIIVLTEPIDNLDDAVAMWEQLRRNNNNGNGI